jgi:hypothetical protein
MDHREYVPLLVRADAVLAAADIDLGAPGTTNDDALDLVRLQMLVQNLSRAGDRADEAVQALEIAGRLLRRAVDGQLPVPGADSKELRSLLGAIGTAAPGGAGGT